MTTATITLTDICSGGNHLTFSVTGDVAATVRADIGDLTSQITDEDKIAFVKVLAKLAKMVRTNNQVRQLLQSGIAINV